MFKWLFHILIFATNDGSGKYQNKEKPLKPQRKLGLATLQQIVVVWLIVLNLYVQVNNLSVISGPVFLGWTSTKVKVSCSMT